LKGLKKNFNHADTYVTRKPAVPKTVESKRPIGFITMLMSVIVTLHLKIWTKLIHCSLPQNSHGFKISDCHFVNSARPELCRG